MTTRNTLGDVLAAGDRRSNEIRARERAGPNGGSARPVSTTGGDAAEPREGVESQAGQPEDQDSTTKIEAPATRIRKAQRVPMNGQRHDGDLVAKLEVEQQETRKFLDMTEAPGRFIMYRPDLRDLLAGVLGFCPSVNAMLLLVQLEFWSVRMSDKPGAFYKYSRAPDESDKPRPAYRDGDSLAEELRMTRYELDTAWKQIGVHYRSKAEFDQTPIELRFQGLPYARYFDRLRKRTFYVRDDAWFSTWPSEWVRPVKRHGANRKPKAQVQ